MITKLRILSVIIAISASLYGQSDMNKQFHNQLQGSYQFTEENILPQEFYEQPGMLKSANADFGNTPDWIWVKQFGGTASDAGTAIISDAMGNIYVAGYFSGSLTIGNETIESTGTTDMVIMKLSQTCYPLWYKHVATSAETTIRPESIVLDNSGNIVVSGYFNAPSISIDGTVLNRIGNQDIFITKLSGAGNFAWSKSYGQSTRSLSGSKIKADGNNNYYCISSESYTFSKLVKFNVNGQVISNNSIPDYKYIEIEIQNSTLYLAGTVEGIYEGGPASVHLLFLSRNDLNLNNTWLIYADALELYSHSNLIDISVTSDENIYLLGTLSRNSVWDEDTMTVYTNYPIPFISLINSAGQILWTKYTSIGYSYCVLYNLVRDAVNNLFVFGNVNDTIKYDTLNVYPGNFVFKCNSDGYGLWTSALPYRPVSVNRYSTDRFITAGTNKFENIVASRFTSGAVIEYSSNITSNSGSGLISGMETDTSGNVYSFGGLSGSGEIFGRTYSDFKGCFISKHNSKGELIWIEFIRGGFAQSSTLGNSMILNTDYNSLFFTGSITDSLNISSERLTIDDGNQFLAKYTLDGVFEWVRSIDGFTVSYTSLSTDKLGDVIFSGGFAGNVTIADVSFTGLYQRNAYIAKFDKNGELKWAAPISSDNFIYTGITSTDQNNMIYFTGESLPGNINFNGLPINTEDDNQSGDILLAKLDQNGTPLWIKTFGIGNSENRQSAWPVNIITSPAGHSYITGWYADSIKFDDILVTKPAYIKGKYAYSFFLVKIDPSGNAVWVNPIYEEKYDFNYNEIDLDENGNCYIMARFRDTLMFGDDYIVPNAGPADMFITKYYSNGSLDWVKTIESTSSPNLLQALAVYDSMSLFAGGYFSSPITLDPVTISTSNQHGFITLLSQGRLNCMEITSSCSDYVCSGKNDGYIDITVSGGTPPYTFTWSNGEITEDIEGLTSGEYSVTAIDSRLCIMKKTIELDSVVTFQGSELCMVTVNNNNKIVLVWEKDYGKNIQSYRLYREKTKDNYIQIAEVPFENLSVYSDQTSAPDEYSHFYKIKAVDVCGDSSEFSAYHKSIHLWTALGVSGEVTLTWDEYQGFDYNEYRIFRGNSLSSMQQIRTISSSSESWTDPDPPAGQVFYRVQVVKPEACLPTAKKADDYSSTVSNYDEETIGMIVTPPGQQLMIYPNPFKEKTLIEFSNPGNTPWQLVITDLTGKVVRIESNITSGEFDLERGNLVPGTYIIELSGEKVYRRKLIVQ